MAEPHPHARARHEQECRNETLYSFEELHALAGRYDAYPAPPDLPECCPVCGGEAAPLATYCSDACRHAAQKRLMAAAFRKGAGEPEIRYSFDPPTKR